MNLSENPAAVERAARALALGDFRRSACPESFERTWPRVKPYYLNAAHAALEAAEAIEEVDDGAHGAVA